MAVSENWPAAKVKDLCEEMLEERGNTYLCSRFKTISGVV